MRQVVLDTETTGLEPALGHRVVELGAVAIVDRKLGATFQRYLNPEREIDASALKVHRITREKLQDQPRFAEVCDEFLEFVRDAEVIMHNAAFDLAFLDAELEKAGREKFMQASECKILDTLDLARDLHPGLQNNLNALCERYNVDKSQRDVHGALIDAELLARVYLAMTGGQIALGLNPAALADAEEDAALLESGIATPVIRASAEELAAHERFMQTIVSGKRVPAKAVGGTR